MAVRGLLNRLVHRPPAEAKRWPVLQVEVTSRCLLHCGFCPNKNLGENWLRGDLPWDVYRDCLGPHLGRFETVYLQGWGEPLLHPRLWDMVALAKSAGARVGFTTCGGLLGEETAHRILDGGLDILSISFAGATPVVHQRLRVGSSFDELAANVGRLTRLRREHSRSRPFVELHFLMQRDNMADLPAFVCLAKELGADEVVATNVTYVPNERVAAMAAYGESPEPRHEALLAAAEAEAKRLGVKFRAYPLSPVSNVLECDAHPADTCYVTCTGQVAPCVYLGLPVRNQIPRLFNGESWPTEHVSFGDIRQGFLEAFEGPERAAFCAPFRNRLALGRSPLAVLQGSDVQLPAPPEPCKGCYKLLGL